MISLELKAFEVQRMTRIFMYARFLKPNRDFEFFPLPKTDTSVFSNGVSDESSGPGTISQTQDSWLPGGPGPAVEDPLGHEEAAEENNGAPSETASLAPLRDNGANVPTKQSGFLAWSQVVMMHLVNFNTFGYMLSFGIFQEYYVRNLHLDPSDVSWVGTVELFFVYFMGAFSGRAMDSGYFRLMLIVGLGLQVLGIFMTTIATKYWQLFLAQGVCQGIGNGLVFWPAIAHAAAYFPPGSRAFPISCIACGGGTGGLVYPAIAQMLLTRLGFAWTVRVMAFIVLFNAIVVISFTRPRAVASGKGALVDWGAFREPAYVLFCVGMFFTFWGLYFAYYYVRQFGRDILRLSRYASFSLLLIINGAGIPGRLIPALLSDGYIGPVNMIAITTLLAAIMVYAWIPVIDETRMYIWVAFYGFLGGGVQTLFQSSSSSFAPDTEKSGSQIGMVFTIVSFACLTGPPIAGRLLEVYGGQYLAAQVFGGTVMLIGSVFLLAARFVRTGLHIRARC